MSLMASEDRAIYLGPWVYFVPQVVRYLPPSRAYCLLYIQQHRDASAVNAKDNPIYSPLIGAEDVLRNQTPTEDMPLWSDTTKPPDCPSTKIEGMWYSPGLVRWG